MELLTSDIFLDLFQHRGWEIKEDRYSLFNRFCKTYDSFATQEEKALFLKISQLVVNVTLPDYSDYSINLLLRINTLNNEERVINIAPMKNTNERISSSDFVAYLCKSKESFYNQELAGKIIQVYGLEHEFETLDGNLFVVDDFIGTGTTASSAFEYYQKRGIKRKKLFICSYFVTTFFLQSAFYKNNEEHSKADLSEAEKIRGSVICRKELHFVFPAITLSVHYGEWDVIDFFFYENNGKVEACALDVGPTYSGDLFKMKLKSLFKK